MFEYVLYIAALEILEFKCALDPLMSIDPGVIPDPTQEARLG
jgi:hypothetical protein